MIRSRGADRLEAIPGCFSPEREVKAVQSILTKGAAVFPGIFGQDERDLQDATY
jgi:hypothetical protein